VHGAFAPQKRRRMHGENSQKPETAKGSDQIQGGGGFSTGMRKLKVISGGGIDRGGSPWTKRTDANARILRKGVDRSGGKKGVLCGGRGRGGLDGDGEGLSNVLRGGRGRPKRGKKLAAAGSRSRRLPSILEEGKVQTSIQKNGELGAARRDDVINHRKTGDPAGEKAPESKKKKRKIPCTERALGGKERALAGLRVQI